MSSSADLFTDGTGYERHMGRWSRLVGEDFLAWLDVPARSRWLDVGCGNGAFTEEIVVRASPAAVVAIDPSEGQLAFARTRAATAMADFRNAGAEPLPFGDAEFDVAVMALVIAFVRDPANAVVEMTRVVRPGGTVAAYMWDFTKGTSPVSPVIAAMESIGMDPPLPPQPQASRADVLRQLWTDAGLAAIEARPITIAVGFSNFDDFWESSTLPVGPLGKAVEAMPADRREQLRSRLREALVAAPDGRIVFEARANAIKGRVT